MFLLEFYSWIKSLFIYLIDIRSSVMRKGGLAYKLSLEIISAIVIVVGALLIFNYTASRKMILESVENSAGNLTNAVVNKIDGVLKTIEQIPENKVYILESYEIQPDRLHEFIRLTVENNKEIFGSCVAYEPYGLFKDTMYYAPYYYWNGDVVKYKNLADTSYNYPERSWYNIPKEQKRNIWTSPYFDEGGGDVLMCTYSVPIYKDMNSDKVFNGVITADISLKWLDDLVDRTRVSESSYAILFDKNGAFISHPIQEYEFNETIYSIGQKFNKHSLEGISKVIFSGENGFIKFYSEYLNKNCYMYYAPLKTTGWTLGVVIPINELFADLHNLSIFLLVIGVCGISLILLLVILISKKMTRPLTKLTLATEVIGAGNFDFKIPAPRSNDEIAQLGSSINLMQKELKSYIENLRSTTAAKERIESELKIAHDIQQGIIPKTFPPFPERSDLDIFGILKPARDVGGDLYDFFFIREDELCFIIGDVSGKGVPASLFMAITRTLFRAKAVQDARVNQIVESINNELCQSNDNSMFVTFFLGIINLKTGVVDYCNAGHNYPCLIRNSGKVEMFPKTHGPALGVIGDIDFSSNRLDLSNRDTIVLYTDGITEAMNVKNALYGEERLFELLKKVAGRPAKTITNAVVDDVIKFTEGAEQSDDITLLTLTYQKES